MRMEDNGIDEDTVSEFKEAFELLDEAKKGSISKQDLKLAFKKYGVRVAEESLDEAFKEADVDKNGLLEFSEFFTVMTRKMRKASTEEKVRQAFQAFDPENRGYIPKADLQEALTTMGIPLSTKELSEFYSLTENEKGEIRYELFITALFMKKQD